MERSRTWIFYAAGLLLAGLVVLTAWLSQDRLSPVVVGSPAPTFTAYDLQGAPASIEKYRGEVVLLNIWATWCGPCKKEMPSLQRLYEEIGDDSFQIVAVSIDRAADGQDRANPLDGRLQAFADSLGLTFALLHDPSGGISALYQTTGVPESFVLDREGTILRRVTGPLEWDAPANAAFIREALSGAEPETQ